MQKGFGIDVATVFVDETLAFQSFDNSSATASNCNYDQILSEQSSHTASFLPSKSCIGLAHTIIYVDASKGTLAKITVPPISSNVVFWSVNDTLLPISAYYVQEISRLTTDVVEALVMVRGLQNPRGVHIDISAR